jgi:hypothetical protein
MIINWIGIAGWKKKRKDKIRDKKIKETKKRKQNIRKE